MLLSKVPKEAFASGLLNLDVHDRLLLNLERVVKKAGVPTHAVWSKLSDFCEPKSDYAWVRDLHSSADFGLVYVGKLKVPADAKMRAITGACLRNYTDARMFTVQEVIRLLKDDSLPDATLLLIPNFCVDKTDGGDIPTWEVQLLLGMLLKRMSAGQKTVLYISSWTALEKQYGESFKDHLQAHYSVMEHGGESYTPILTT